MKKARLHLLAEVLHGAESFAERGFEAKASPESLLVQRDGHVRGIWTVEGDRYIWTAAGYCQPSFSTIALAEAVKFTLIEISKKV
jgi:hypothetical protein